MTPDPRQIDAPRTEQIAAIATILHETKAVCYRPIELCQPDLTPTGLHHGWAERLYDAGLRAAAPQPRDALRARIEEELRDLERIQREQRNDYGMGIELAIDAIRAALRGAEGSSKPAGRARGE